MKKNLKKKSGKVGVLRILGLAFIITGIITIIVTHNSSKNQQIFQADILNNTVQVAEADIENIVVTQNVPIPEELKQKMEEEAKAKKEAEEQARLEAEKKAQEEEETRKKAEELRVAQQKTQVTSRGGSSTTRATGTVAEYQAYAKELCLNTYGWSGYDFECLVKLWTKESNWNANAHNSSSGAHGIPQSLPASKMASEGDDYYTNGKTQIRWRT